MQEKAVMVRIQTPKTNLVYYICVEESHLFSKYDIPGDDDVVYLDCKDITELDNLTGGLQHLREILEKDEVC